MDSLGPGPKAVRPEVQRNDMKTVPKSARGSESFGEIPRSRCSLGTSILIGSALSAGASEDVTR
jgi:hypothetical protein